MGDRLRAGKLSRYVTGHPRQLSLAIPLWVGAISISLGWEGNGRSGVALVMRQRQWFIHIWPMKGRWAPRLRSFGFWPSFTFFKYKYNSGVLSDAVPLWLTSHDVCFAGGVCFQCPTVQAVPQPAQPAPAACLPLAYQALPFHALPYEVRFHVWLSSLSWRRVLSPFWRDCFSIVCRMSENS